MCNETILKLFALGNIEANFIFYSLFLGEVKDERLAKLRLPEIDQICVRQNLSIKVKYHAATC